MTAQEGVGGLARGSHCKDEERETQSVEGLAQVHGWPKARTALRTGPPGPPGGPPGHVSHADAGLNFGFCSCPSQVSQGLP